MQRCTIPKINYRRGETRAKVTRGRNDLYRRQYGPWTWFKRLSNRQLRNHHRQQAAAARDVSNAQPDNKDAPFTMLALRRELNDWWGWD